VVPILTEELKKALQRKTCVATMVDE